MIVVRILLSLVIAAAAAVALKCVTYEPARCNRLAQELTGITAQVFERPESLPSVEVPVIARRTMQRMSTCLHPCTITPHYLVISAANLRAMQRYDDAAAEYRRALELDRRPEVYFNLGMTELAAGRREEAIAHLVMAGRSGYLINEITDIAARDEVERRLRATTSDNDPW